MTEPEPPPSEKKGLAIASLICGLLICIPLLSGLAALILGILALTRKGQGGKGMAIAGIVLGVLGIIVIPIVAAIALPVLKVAQETANRTACIHTLRSIDCALRMYESREGKFPSDLKTLYTSRDVPDLQVFLCRCCGERADGSFKTHYVYRAPLQADPLTSNLRIVAYDDAPCHGDKHNGRGSGRVVLFTDGSARFLPEPDFQALLATQTPRR